MNIFLWILQSILAIMFIMAGWPKLFQPKDKMADNIVMLIEESSLGLVRFIGIAELLGAIGVIVPQLTGILPALTPIAAIGLAIIMVLAAGYHARKKEYRHVGITALLCICAVIVAYVRF